MEFLSTAFGPATLALRFDLGKVRLPGDSQRESGRFALIDSRESIRRESPIFITYEQLPRIASNRRFAIFGPPKRDSHNRGSVGEL